MRSTHFLALFKKLSNNILSLLNCFRLELWLYHKNKKKVRWFKRGYSIQIWSSAKFHNFIFAKLNCTNHLSEPNLKLKLSLWEKKLQFSHLKKFCLRFYIKNIWNFAKWKQKNNKTQSITWKKSRKVWDFHARGLKSLIV